MKQATFTPADAKVLFGKLCTSETPWAFEIDLRDGWTLTHYGNPTRSRTWYPQDEVDVLIAATLIHRMNGRSTPRLTPELREGLEGVAKLTEERLRSALDTRAFSLLVYLRRPVGIAALRG